ncbi:GNAT family N-acetyltransferase [Microbispora sp. NEAU-D428]|uniref:GNAT family N-acetyltransferase n=1 Tax=Microbispora sitophila TaxID=2771537 RepID=UPI001867CDD2|nr:GNAT family N-acetyltransferase [Microbispora sitophila]MBE3009074.1 GNAT family N-acetyltransferase [Microbispora sitophila]
MTEERRTMLGADGVPVFSYLEGVRDGSPWAYAIEDIGPGAADAITSGMPGWAVSAPVGLGRALLDRGARLLRHMNVMLCDLPIARPVADAAPDGFRLVPCDRSPAEIFPAWFAAYPPGHPDYRPRDGEKALKEELVPLLSGEEIGPLLPCSVLAVRDEGEVVGGVLVTDSNRGPWIADVFRHPDRSPRGLGALMLSTVLVRAGADGLTGVGLVVTEGNPARRLYERLGFRVVDSAMTVKV